MTTFRNLVPPRFAIPEPLHKKEIKGETVEEFLNRGGKIYYAALGESGDDGVRSLHPNRVDQKSKGRNKHAHTTSS